MQAWRRGTIDDSRAGVADRARAVPGNRVAVDSTGRGCITCGREPASRDRPGEDAEMSMGNPAGSIAAQTIAEQHTILRGLVGSSVHGVVVASADDRDEM